MSRDYDPIDLPPKPESYFGEAPADDASEEEVKTYFSAVERYVADYDEWRKRNLPEVVTVSPDFAHNLILVLVLSFAVGCVAFTVTKTKVFAPFRDWVSNRSTWFGNLFSCPYCLGHWLSFGAVAIYRPTLVHLWWPLDLVVTCFVVIALACFVSGLLLKSLTVGANH